jgi:hypothetical protein
VEKAGGLACMIGTANSCDIDENQKMLGESWTYSILDGSFWHDDFEIKGGLGRSQRFGLLFCLIFCLIFFS